MSDPISLDDVRAAAERIADGVHRTPVFTSRTLDALAGRALFFKAESLQRCGAFKARGALNAVRQLTVEQAARGVITDSSGNHGQALAWAARARGVTATVVMPSDAPAVKRAAVADYGATIVLSAPTLAGRAQAVARARAASGATYVPPSQHPHIMAGQGTVALELLEQVPALDALVVPVGGGGLITGCAVAAQSLHPALRVFAAEPAGADDAARSKAAGTHLPPQDHRTVAGGLLVALGPLAWPVIRDRVEAVLTVTDDEIIAATRLLWERMKLVVEPSGATALAAALKGLPQSARRVGIIVSGGNVDLDRLPWQTRSPSSP